MKSNYQSIKCRIIKLKKIILIIQKDLKNITIKKIRIKIKIKIIFIFN
jgi:hypothetical protein